MVRFDAFRVCRKCTWLDADQLRVACGGKKKTARTLRQLNGAIWPFWAVRLASCPKQAAEREQKAGTEGKRWRVQLFGAGLDDREESAQYVKPWQDFPCLDESG